MLTTKALFTLVTSSAFICLALFSQTLVATQTMILNSYGSTTKPESFTYNGHFESNVPTGAIYGSVAGLSQLFLCADIPEPISVPGTYNVNVVAPSTLFSVPGSHQTSYSQQMAATLVNLERSVLTAPTPLNSPTSAQLDALTALNLAEWSILYNWTDLAHVNSSTLNGTNFSMPTSWPSLNPSTNALALSYLGAAAALANNPSWEGVVFLQDNQQNQVLVGVLPAPEPTTIFLLGSGLAMGLLKRKKTKDF